MTESEVDRYIENELLTPPPQYTDEELTITSRTILQQSREISRLKRQLKKQRDRADKYKRKYIKTKSKEYLNTAELVDLNREIDNLSRTNQNRRINNS